MNKDGEPLVSVVIAAYRNPDYVHQAVDSVLSQTFTDYEILVVDDASGEDTIAGYRLPEGVRLLRHDVRRRTAAARNAGIRASRGRYIALLDQDDLWLPDKLAKQVRLLESRPDMALVFCHCTPVDDALSPLASKRKVRRRVRHPLLKLVRGCFIATPSTVLFRRDVAESVGLFDESVIGASDWDFYLRVARSHEFGAIAESLVLYRMHPGQLHRDEHLMRAAKRRVYDKTLAWAEDGNPRLVRRVRQCYCRALRQIAAKQMLEERDTIASLETLGHAIRLWPWNIRSYGLLLRAICLSRKHRGS